MIPEAKNQRHRASRRLAVALAAWLLPGAVQAGVFAEFRYTTVVAAAVNADRIGWIDDQDGVTSLWTRLGTGGAPQIVARSGRDDGAPLGDLSLAASGRWIAWRTGEASPAAGRTANPADLVAGPQSTIWVAAPGGAPCHVAAGDSPRLAHLANRIAFLRAGDLWMADLSPSCADTRRSARLALHLRNPLSGIVWSPRDDAIAFVVHRGSYGFNGAYSLIGVFHPGSDRSVWIAPAFERDTAPSWSPDGKQIAFLRVAGVSYEHAAARAWDAPARFQVMIGDVATGVAHTVWSSPGADADFRQWHEPTTPPLRWLDAHHLLLYSEHEGWLHFYRIDLANGALTDLTPGKCEADYGDATSDGTALYVSSNCKDAMQRSLYRIDTHSGAKTLLTPENGVFTNPAVFSGGVALRAAQKGEPQTIAVWASGKFSVVEANPPDDATGVTVQPVHFAADDGTSIEGQLFLPPQRAQQRLPAIVFVHGGPERQMLTDSHASEFYGRYFWMNRHLAMHGYAVLSVNYRSGVGSGRDFRRAANAGPFGASEYGDVLAGARYLQARDDVDKARIGIWGQSWGGYLTALALARNSDIFKAGVDLCGVHDHAFGTADVGSTVHDFGVEPSQADLALHSSPIADVDRWRSPVLIVSGDDDPEVPVEESVDLAARLKERGVDVEELLFPDELHSFVLNRTWDTVYDRSRDFFDRKLAGGVNKPAEAR